MIHPAPAVLRLTGHDGLLSAIPTALGFHPTDSIVVVALAGPNRRLGPVVRADLSLQPTTADTLPVVAVLAHQVEPYADETALIAYTDHPHQLDLKTAAKPLMALRPLIDAAIVPNRPHTLPDHLVAAAIVNGRRVLSSRQELHDSVQYRPGSGEQPLALAAFDTVQSRDGFIVEAMGRADVVPALIAAAQVTPDSDPRAAELCAALAVLAYRIGDGALAQVAIDRAMSCEPHHGLATLMLAVMELGLPPQALEAAIG